MRAPPKRFWLGLIGLVLAHALLVARVSVVCQFFTPLAWTLFLFLVDGWIERVRGSSPMTRAPGQVLWAAVASIAIWYVFEAYNLRLAGWRYDGLPESLPVRLFGYVWSFATIGPAMLITRELVATALYRGDATALPIDGGERVPGRVLLGLTTFGAACLLAPLLVPLETSRYLWALVWAGFIFAIDPVNALLGRASITGDLFLRDPRRLVSLLVAGLVCGLLWESWNYWATTRWVYTFPFPGAGVKLFEMPLIGFLGFPPFAVEFFVLTELTGLLWGGNADFAERRRGYAAVVS